MSKLARFEIETEDLGINKLTINDQDLSDAFQTVSMVSTINKPTEVYLTLKPGSGPITGEGIVYVNNPVEGNSVEVIRDFLNGIDAASLSDEALRRSGFGDDPIHSMIEVLKEWAGR
jgi:hypothetical protein